MNIWSSIDCNECTYLTKFFKMNVSKTKKRRNGEPLIKKRRRNRKPDPPWQTGEGATLEQRRLIAETAFCVIERLRESDVFFSFMLIPKLRRCLLIEVSGPGAEKVVISIREASGASYSPWCSCLR